MSSDLIPGYVSYSTSSSALFPSSGLETASTGNFILSQNYVYGLPAIVLWERN